METPFNIEIITERYSNVRVGSDSSESSLHFYIKNENSSDCGEFYYRKEDKYWMVIKDNFPMRRKGYSFDLPVKFFEQLEYYFEQIGMKLFRV